MINYKSPSLTDTLPNAPRVNNDTPTRQLRAVDQTQAKVDDLALDHDPLTIDAMAEDAYWAEHYADSPYVPEGTPYEHVRAAYRFGWESRRRLPSTQWTIAMPRLRAEWNADPANFVMSWSEAERAVRDAWNHAGTQRPH